MSPSSPVSVGILPSSRTLEVGVSHLDSSLLTLEQFRVADDPFTDSVSAVGKKNLDGTTIQLCNSTTDYNGNCLLTF